MALISIFISTFLLIVHPLHISVTEITFDPKEREFEIMLRVFADDLELAIRKLKNDEKLKLLGPSNTNTDKLAWEYLESKFKLAVDGKAQPMKYLGHKIDEDVLIFYVQVQPVRKFKTIDITNSIISELYEDQENLINIAVSEEIKSLRLTRDNPSGKLSFDLK